MDSENDFWLVLSDANGYGDSEYPFLIFNSKIGGFTIADDYETSNDITAREFTLRKNDAVSLAIALLQYVKDGKTTALLSNRAGDVVDSVLKQASVSRTCI